MSTSADHTRLMKSILLLLGDKAADKGRFFRMETGVGLNMRTDEKFAYGINGQADIMGIIVGGRHIWLECKTGGAVQSSNQKNFQRMIERFGGLYSVVRSPEEALRFVLENC